MSPRTWLLATAGLAAGAAAGHLLAERSIGRFENLEVDEDGLPGRRFYLRGVGLHFRDVGAGYPVVMVHGFGASMFSLRFTEAALAPHFRVLSLDLPGFGYSDRGNRPDYSRTGHVRLLIEFVERLGISRAVFLGHSFGGGVLQQLAAERPDLVERLVLIAPATVDRRMRMPPAIVVGPMTRFVQASMSVVPGLYARAGRRSVANPAFFTGQEEDGWLQPLRVRGTAAAVRRLLVSLGREQPVDLADIKSPVLLLWGQQDRIVKPAEGRRIAAGLPNARFETLPDAGHLVMEEQPEAANNLILEFLRDLAAEQREAAAERHA